MGSNKTQANHAFVVSGTLEASDEIIEKIEELDDAELVFQTHSTDKLYVSEGD
jgi:hypothetical protein